jgi:hypothetical protein
VRREEQVGLSFHGHDHRALAQLERLLDGLGQAASTSGCRAGLEAVNHNLDIVLDLAIEREIVGQVINLAVHPRPHIPRAGKVGDVEVKRKLAAALNASLEPMRERHREALARPNWIREVLFVGSKRARAVAGATLERVREAMKISYGQR